MSDFAAEIEKYVQGPVKLRMALAGFPADKLAVPLPPGEWSALDVVCHLADFEIVCADRIKAVLAEDGPQIPGRDENCYRAKLHYDGRNLNDELAVIETVRRQMLPLLKSLGPADLQRVGIHSVDGPLTLETLVARIAKHVPHHADFIARKKQLLLKPA
jgi:hypothetical protein